MLREIRKILNGQEMQRKQGSESMFRVGWKTQETAGEFMDRELESLEY